MKAAHNTKFFEYLQNNSGGNFHYDNDAGITELVVIEALDHNQANSIAESIGLYWDGCSDDRDCPCCGDRWHEATHGTPYPSEYGQPLHNRSITPQLFKSKESKGEACVHYLDGTKEWFTDGVSEFDNKDSHSYDPLRNVKWMVDTNED